MRSVAGIVLSILLMLFGTSFKAPSPAGYSIDLTISGIRNNNGRIQLQIYRDQASFAKEEPWKVTYISKANLTGSTIKQKISGFDPGVYGFALLDDENSNKEMDYNWSMLPIEGFGFSDYYHKAWSKPKFDDFKFKLSGNKSVTMKIRYVR